MWIKHTKLFKSSDKPTFIPLDNLELDYPVEGLLTFESIP